MRPDRTITRASRQGTRTIPVESRSKQVRGDSRIFPDEIALAVEMARNERIERDIAAYGIRKRES